MTGKRIFIWSIIFLPVFLFGQQFFANHPEIKWKVFETDHFKIHYSAETAWTAAMAAKVAEKVIPDIEKMYQYKPDKKYSLIIKDVDDYSNGGAFFFNNKVEIWAQNLDYPMRGTTHWLYNVFTHELTHMINIQASIKTSVKFPFGFIQILGYEKEKRADVVRGFPNVLVSYPVPSINIPVWFAEGTAQYQNRWSRYDFWDSHRDMILRDRFEYKKVLSYSSMGVFGKNSHGNESSYNQGFNFVTFLAAEYGDSVLKKIVEDNSGFKDWTFEQALEKATGATSEALYNEWYHKRKSDYDHRLNTIKTNLVRGKFIEKDGFANLNPSLSPDGKTIAYISNKGNDYWSQNSLILKQTDGSHEQSVADHIASGPVFSPDGKYLVYSKADEPNSNGSFFQDIYIYDLKGGKEYRLSKNLRARQVDWSVNDDLVFVISQDGSGFVYTVNIKDVDFKREFNTRYIRIHGGEIQNVAPVDDVGEWRKIEYVFQTDPQQISSFQPGIQYYNPKWNNDGTKFVFNESNGYGRNIKLFDLNSHQMSDLLVRDIDDRDPVFSSDGKRIYYASDSTGIYNIYSCDLNGRNQKVHTNVTGGAFMPDIQGRSMVYALYDSLGYKIAFIDNLKDVDFTTIGYQLDYPTHIPRQHFHNVDTLVHSGQNYRSRFNNLQILPRLFFDYGTFKPGLFIMNSDPLDKWLFFGGAAVNFDLDRDVYLYTAYNGFKPTIFLEMYNLTQNLSDTSYFHYSDSKPDAKIPLNLFFNLYRFAVGGEYTMGALNMKAQLIYNKYDATIKNDEIRIPDTGEKVEDIPFSYTYLKGPQLALSASWDSRRRDRFTDIAPRGGRYVFFRYTREWNQFLDDFKVSAINIEKYKKYYFDRFELTWEEFFRIPGTRYHTLSFKFNGSAIDQSVDSFFNFFAGGLIGLKGYSYYSIGGRFMGTGQISWKFPLWRNIDWEVANFYFDKMFVNLYVDAGDAWNKDVIPSANDFKRDIGIELRMDLFSYHLFPTKVFFDIAFPLDEFRYYDDKREVYVDYKREPRFYFGILFDFDLRERHGGTLWSPKPFSAY